MNLRLHRLAVSEIDHEVDYYESRQTGLGAELSCRGSEPTGHARGEPAGPG